MRRSLHVTTLAEESSLSASMAVDFEQVAFGIDERDGSRRHAGGYALLQEHRGKRQLQNIAGKALRTVQISDREVRFEQIRYGDHG